MNGSSPLIRPALRPQRLPRFARRRLRRRQATLLGLRPNARLWRSFAFVAALVLAQVPLATRAQNSLGFDPASQSFSPLGATEFQMGRDTLPNLLANPSPTPLAPAPSATPAPAAAAGTPQLVGGGTDGPVTFMADEVEYDRERERVVASGRVEAWQGGRFLRADRFTYDRNTRIALVQGNVQIIEADGQVFYAEEAELGEGFRDGVLTEVRARLAQNARLAGNGARRTDGVISDISRPVYSSCNLCEADPTRPPLWQMRARMGTQDRESQRISYQDATLQMGGVPVFYTPFLSHPDPSTPRASGFLFPANGYTRFLGAFTQTPYFWAIDDSQDLLITPTVSTLVSPNLGLEYRRRFNNGFIQAQGSIGYMNAEQSARATGTGTGSPGINGHIFSRGRFDLNENWRIGFDANLASSDSYLRTYKFEYRRVLISTAFVEGFWGTETYARLDTRYYQGLRSTDNLSAIPVVGPYGILEHAPRNQLWGGNLTTDVGILGLTRPSTVFSQRLASRVSWERPAFGPVGDVWTFRTQFDGTGYYAGNQQLNTFNPLPEANGIHANGNIRAAVDWRLPLIRSAGEWGTQLIEPRVQFVTGPHLGRQLRFPNEDALDFEFTDANLFQLNRYTGRDRFEGTTRVDTQVRGSWNFVNGGRVESLVGRSYRATDSTTFPQNVGLNDRASDWVTRTTFSPVSWVDIIARNRFDSQSLQHRATDANATFSLGRVSVLDNVFVSAGYLYNPPLPQFSSTIGRNEVAIGAGFQYRTAAGGIWKASGSVRYNLVAQTPAIVAGTFGYEDECFIIEGRLLRRYIEDTTAPQAANANTVFLVRLGFKTVGDYFFRAI
ncbi:LPS assembly protein LptD [Sediminicoccus sp. KRV36]|uniref:LPS-assembly protein LptD n=1 Tax=Sediminicoccus sp. KRV36 TaxID=3133721 RepID=UPI00200F3F71|nr:LPS assembly protein LptD [Sediminicoccus rosea]UPY36237.1 LPS assembly protein LptD [Sediminicoccus rosea]